jgi:hypothetical protein
MINSAATLPSSPFWATQSICSKRQRDYYTTSTFNRQSYPDTRVGAEKVVGAGQYIVWLLLRRKT